MRVHLLFPDRDAPRTSAFPPGSDDLIADLDLAPILDVMAPRKELGKLCPAVLLNPVTEPGTIRWRQAVLADVLADPTGMSHLFELAGRALESQRGSWLWSGRTADSALARSVHGLAELLPLLTELAGLAAAQLAVVRSPGLRQLYRRLVDDLDADYLHVQRSPLGRGQRPGQRHRGADERVGAQPGLVRGAVQVAHRPVDFGQIGPVASGQRRGQFAVDVADRGQHAGATEAGGVAVPELHRLAGARGSPGRDAGLGTGAVRQCDRHVERGASAGIQDLQCLYRSDLESHRRHLSGHPGSALKPGGDTARPGAKAGRKVSESPTSVPSRTVHEVGTVGRESDGFSTRRAPPPAATVAPPPPSHHGVPGSSRWVVAPALILVVSAWLLGDPGS